MFKKKIFIAGHLGMVGSALVRKLKKKNLILKSRKYLDLSNQAQVQKFFKKEKPDEIYMAAAKTGGIYSSTNFPAEFIYQNLIIESNIVHNAFLNGIKKILFLGSSCIYPRLAKQPIAENELLRGPLDYTNEPYSIAKIAGIKLCESYNRQFGKSHGIDYRSVIPTNLYGPGDDYDLKKSHVIPALMRRFHEAKIKKTPKIILWGTGKPKREFLHVDDMAEACIRIMNIKKKKFKNFTKETCSHVNIGSGSEITIIELASLIKNIVGYTGKITFDKKKPDGVPRKLLNNNLIKNFGWTPKIKLENGLLKTYEDFKNLYYKKKI
jgi:GDP-L-fucose synthase